MTPLLHGTPWGAVAVLVTVVLIADLLLALDAGAESVLRILALTGGHAALLVTALAWAGREPTVPLTLVLVVAIGQAAALATLHPLGGLAWIAVPIALWLVTTRDQRRALGIRRAEPSALVLGALAGGLLGAHLLVSASLTLGYQPRLVPAGAVLAAALYDAGVQVPATELFFRGALFNRAQRRWSFGAGATISTAACLLRYGADPLLPKTVEIVTGMMFYVALLSATNAWLFWRFGTIVPGVTAALLFFLAYRLLGVD